MLKPSATTYDIGKGPMESSGSHRRSGMHFGVRRTVARVALGGNTYRPPPPGRMKYPTVRQLPSSCFIVTTCSDASAMFANELA